MRATNLTLTQKTTTPSFKHGTSIKFAKTHKLIFVVFVNGRLLMFEGVASIMFCRLFSMSSFIICPIVLPVFSETFLSF